MRIAAFVLLVILGLAGLFGGVILLVTPDGSGLGLTREMLPTWFPLDYSAAGLVLVVAFGLVPLVTALGVLRRHSLATVATSLLGAALVGWMVVQVLLIGLILPPMQIGFALLGVALVLVGLRLRHTLRRPVRQDARA